MYVTLEEAKKHLVVEHDEDDAYIESLIAVAEDTVANFVNQPLADLEKDGSLPASLVHAIKITIGKLYAYREGDAPVRSVEVPFTLAALFMPYRKET